MLFLQALLTNTLRVEHFVMMLVNTAIACVRNCSTLKTMPRFIFKIN